MHHTDLPAWLPISIIRLAHLDAPDPPPGKAKIAICCPLSGHEDKHPSAFATASGVFGCSLCTGGQGRSSKWLADALGVSWEIATGRPTRAGTHARPAPAPSPIPPRPTRTPSITRELLRETWERCASRALDDDAVEKDAAVYDYLRRRRLLSSWNERAFGVVGAETPMPPDLHFWYRRGFRVVVPLYDLHGRLATMQARSIFAQLVTKMSPPDHTTAGTIFANRLGLSLLRGDTTGPKIALVGEGLTDHLAWSAHASIPEYCVCGVGLFQHAFGAWTAGRRIILAIDQDETGNRAVETAGRAAKAAGAISVHRLRYPPNCKDACDALTALGDDGFIQLIATMVEELRS